MQEYDFKKPGMKIIKLLHTKKGIVRDIHTCVHILES